jgi:hypothetical protein
LTPYGEVDTSQRLLHVIRFSPDAQLKRKARPVGVDGCEVWLAIRPAAAVGPAKPDELRFVARAASSPVKIPFSGEDAGKTAWYWIRWAGKRDRVGPWGQAFSGTIVG